MFWLHGCAVKDDRHCWTCNMLLRDFAPPVRLLSLLCLALPLLPPVQASLGDRQPEFKSCVAVSFMQLRTLLCRQ